jgi:uroporphyrinogen-III synthase
MLNNKTVIVTQSSADGGSFKDSLEKLGAYVYEFPTIRLTRNPVSPGIESVMKNPAGYDVILFTSRHAAIFFNELVLEMNAVGWKKIPVIAVGESTAAVLTENGFSAAMVPQEFTSAALAGEIKNVRGKKVLLPRSQLADTSLVKSLEAKGAVVVAFLLYTTDFIDGRDERLEQMLAEKMAQPGGDCCITFTSPSTVNGFTRRLEKSTLDEVVKLMPAVCIGPVTADAARQAGFAHILVAAPHTLAGIAAALLIPGTF